MVFEMVKTSSGIFRFPSIRTVSINKIIADLTIFMSCNRCCSNSSFSINFTSSKNLYESYKSISIPFSWITNNLCSKSFLHSLKKASSPFLSFKSIAILNKPNNPLLFILFILSFLFHHEPARNCENKCDLYLVLNKIIYIKQLLFYLRFQSTI